MFHFIEEQEPFTFDGEGGDYGEDRIQGSHGDDTLVYPGPTIEDTSEAQPEILPEEEQEFENIFDFNPSVDPYPQHEFAEEFWSEEVDWDSTETEDGGTTKNSQQPSLPDPDTFEVGGDGTYDFDIA